MHAYDTSHGDGLLFFWIVFIAALVTVIVLLARNDEPFKQQRAAMTCEQHVGVQAVDGDSVLCKDGTVHRIISPER